MTLSNTHPPYSRVTSKLFGKKNKKSKRAKAKAGTYAGRERYVILLVNMREISIFFGELESSFKRMHNGNVVVVSHAQKSNTC